MTQLGDRTAGAGTRAASPRLLQVATVLALLALLWQFGTAGRYISTGKGFDLHELGAYAVHATSLLVLVAAFLHARAHGGAPRWPVLLAAAVFLATFVQAALGHVHQVTAHVPGALVLSVGLVWLTAWAFMPSRAPA